MHNLLANSQIWIGGQVSIDPSAAIAPGVLLQADPSAQITIGAGACVGMGVVIHAVGGQITIGAGANLGAGVLIYGKLDIGNHACIGTAASVINHSVNQGQMVAPGSLLHNLSDLSTEPPPEPDQLSTPKPTDKLRVHAQVHLQQFLGKIFVSGSNTP